MSFVNSPTYNLPKFLCCILSNLFRNEFNIRRSKKFADHIDSVCVNSDKILVSFDVASLFTSMPVDNAVDLVVEFFVSDE